MPWFLPILVTGRVSFTQGALGFAWADVVVTMGRGHAGADIPSKRYIHWDLPDPAGRPLDQVQAIRNEIARRVGILSARAG